MNKSLFSALALEKIAVSLAIGLIVIVAALNIVASLILLVMEKHRDIAILKTMGASARSVMAIFVAQGLFIGLVGTTAGASVGLGLATVLDRYKLIRIPADVYQVSYLPVHRAAARFPARRRGRRGHLPRGDDLPVAASRAPGPGTGVAL